MVRFGWGRCAVTALLGAALVAVPSPAQAADITITGTITTISGAPLANRSIFVLADNEIVLNTTLSAGGTFTASGRPGDWTFAIGESGGTDPAYGLSAQTSPVQYTTSSNVSLAAPIHALDLSVEEPGGAPAAATVALDCYNRKPLGWAYVQTNSSREVTGDATFSVANAAPGDEDCSLRVDPENGPIRYDDLAGNPATYTHIVSPGSVVSGTVSDGLGQPVPVDTPVYAYDSLGRPTGTAFTNASGQYSVELDPGSHTMHVPWVVTSALQFRLTTELLNYPTSTTRDLAPATDPLTVHVRTPANAPRTSRILLSCNGTPDGQAVIDFQETYVEVPGATDATLPGTATADGTCSLDVAPVVGVRFFDAVVIPDGGDDITVVVDPGVSITGQLAVPDLASYGSSQVTISQDGHETDTDFTETDGSFAFSGLAAGDATVDVAVSDPTWGGVTWQRRVTLSEGAHLTLAPDLDYLVLYLLDESGNPGTGSAQLTCNGSQAADPNSNTYTSTVVTRSGTDVISIPGYAPDTGQCHLEVTWSDNTVTTKDVTLDPSSATSLTLLKNGVVLDGDPETSNDDDGVADATEAYAPNQGDGNADLTPDYQQPDVSSLPENGAALGSGEDYVTIAGPDGSTLELVTTDDVVDPAPRPATVDGPPDGSELPQGFVDFTVADFVPDVNGDVQVVLHVPSTADMNGYAVRDPATGVWTDMPAGDVSFTPTTITLTLHDGGPLDDDPVAGRIRHPGGGTKYDTEVPVVLGQAMTAPNAKGWYDSNVTVKWTVTDNDSSVTAPANTVVSTEGDDVTATAAEVCDRRSNCRVGTLSGLKIDKTKPVVNLAGPANGATYVVGAAPSRSCQGTDPGGSGVPDGGACVVTVTGNPAGAGSVTLTAKATDRAGNTATKVVTYKQVYKANALSSPAAGSKMKVFKVGSTVVVRVQTLNAAGQAVAAAKAPTWVTPKAKGKAKGKANQPVSKVKPDKGTVLIRRGNFWEYRWGTAKAKAGKAYVITVRLDDGTTRTVTIGFG